MKSTTTAYLLWFFLGLFGAHKFYLEKTGIGLLYLFTFGVFGIGWFIDLFTLGGQVSTYNAFFGRRFGNESNNNNTNNIVVNVPGNNASHNPPDIFEQLQRLHDLKEKGILSEDEYIIQKTKVLA